MILCAAGACMSLGVPCCAVAIWHEEMSSLGINKNSFHARTLSLSPANLVELRCSNAISKATLTAPRMHQAILWKIGTRTDALFYKRLHRRFSKKL